jgi:hypothetical protein
MTVSNSNQQPGSEQFRSPNSGADPETSFWQQTTASRSPEPSNPWVTCCGESKSEPSELDCCEGSSSEHSVGGPSSYEPARFQEPASFQEPAPSQEGAPGEAAPAAKRARKSPAKAGRKTAARGKAKKSSAKSRRKASAKKSSKSRSRKQSAETAGYGNDLSDPSAPSVSMPLLPPTESAA